MAKGFTDEDDALLEELGVQVEAKKETGRTARDERVIAGLRKFSVSSIGTAMRRSTGKTATSSSACMPCALTACGCCPTAVLC